MKGHFKFLLDHMYTHGKSAVANSDISTLFVTCSVLIRGFPIMKVQSTFALGLLQAPRAMIVKNPRQVFMKMSLLRSALPSTVCHTQHFHSSTAVAYLPRSSCCCCCCSSSTLSASTRNAPLIQNPFSFYAFLLLLLHLQKLTLEHIPEPGVASKQKEAGT